MATEGITGPNPRSEDASRGAQRDRRIASICVLGVLLLFWAADTVGSWRGTAGLSSSFSYSDNVDLTSNDPESGGILQIRPSVASSRSGSRVQARFNYGPSLVFYPEDTDRTDVQHTLGAGLDAELIERYFFLDVRANANQALIDPRLNSGFGPTVGNRDAFTQQASLTVTPRINLPILDGRFATVRISPGVGFNYTASTAGGDEGLRTGTSDSSVSVTSGPMFTTVPWSLNWRRQVFDTDTGDGLGSVSARIGYIFSARYRLDLTLGYDESRDAFRADDGSTSGVRWNSSFRWTPNSRARFRFGYGQRFFGDTYSFDGTYRHKRWVFDSSYSVTLQSAVTELQEQQVVPIVDLFGNPILDPFNTDQVLTATVTTPILVDDTFLRDQLTLRSSYQKGRNSGSLRWSVRRRQYNEADLDTLDNQLQLQYSRRISGRLTGSAVLNFWDHSEDNPGGFEFVQDSVDLRLSYRLGPKARLGARVGRLSRDADLADSDFSEHRLGVDFSVRF